MWVRNPHCYHTHTHKHTERERETYRETICLMSLGYRSEISSIGLYGQINHQLLNKLLPSRPILLIIMSCIMWCYSGVTHRQSSWTGRWERPVRCVQTPSLESQTLAGSGSEGSPPSQTCSRCNPENKPAGAHLRQRETINKVNMAVSRNAFIYPWSPYSHPFIHLYSP